MSGGARIELLRHGDTGWQGFRGSFDDALCEQGWAQMRAAVVGRAWQAIVSSPMLRCVGFARELAATCGCPLRIDARLREYHFGTWQGVAMETLAREQAEALTRFWANPARHPPPSAENFSAFHDRLCAALDEIARSAVPQRTLVVTHGGVIRLLRCVAERRGFSEMAGLDIPHASLHALAWATPGAV